MKKTIIVTLLIFAAFAIKAQPSITRLDSLMNFYATEYNFNGVAFISYKGKVLLDKGYGYRDIAKEIKNDEHTIFQMGSNTKQFTAEIILQLAMQKKLDLHDKLSKYFPNFPNGEKITLENLLTHTSGIFNYTEDTAWQRNGMKSMQPDEIMALFENKPLGFTPGEKFEYSNSNYMLLGYIIEKVTKEKYEHVVRERILTPLGMTHSGFDFEHLDNKNKATGYYTIQGDKYNPAPVSDSTVTFAAGGLYSDAADLMKWHNAVWSYKLLPKEWQDKAFKPFKDRYGYGWFIDSGYGKTNIGHSGGVPGFYTYVMHIPEDDICISLLQNCEMPSMDNNTICINIIKSMYDKSFKMPSPLKAITVGSEVLQSYIGSYSITPDFTISITIKENQLYAQATGQEGFVMNAESETKFYNKEIGCKIKFVKEDSKVTKLLLEQGGQEIPAIKQ